MKNALRVLSLCVGGILMISASNPVFADETAKQGTPAGKEMGFSNYDRNARGIDAPMYDYYAKKIKEATGITEGTCLDVGSGGGYLGLALAKITNLKLIFLDISAPALDLAKKHIAEDGVQDRAKTLLADVHTIPLADGSVNLVISRGSIPFWKDPAVALKEIYRVLAPGGQAYVGGGRGSAEIRAQIEEKRKELGQAPRPWGGHRGPKGIPHRDYEAVMKTTGIASYKVETSDDGVWIRMWK